MGVRKNSENRTKIWACQQPRGESHLGMHTQAKFVDPITPHIPLRLKPDLAPEKHQTMRKTHAKGWPRVRAFVEFSDLGTLTTFAVKIYIAHFAVPMPSPSVVRAREALASFALHGGVGGWESSSLYGRGGCLLIVGGAGVRRGAPVVAILSHLVSCCPFEGGDWTVWTGVRRVFWPRIVPHSKKHHIADSPNHHQNTEFQGSNFCVKIFRN